MVIEMRDFGRSLVTRASGKATYEKLFPMVASAHGRIVFDFSGVETVTNSFADEVNGHMVFDM